MTRELYLEMRSKGHIGNILYVFYQTESVKRHSQPMGPNEFILFFNMWKYSKEVTERVLHHYDLKFDIRSLSDKSGKIVKYL